MKRRLKENIEINDEVLVDVGPFGEKYRGTVVDINGDEVLVDGPFGEEYHNLSDLKKLGGDYEEGLPFPFRENFTESRKKIIRLTESDLARIVKRVINEQSEMSEEKPGGPKDYVFIEDNKTLNDFIKNNFKVKEGTFSSGNNKIQFSDGTKTVTYTSTLNLSRGGANPKGTWRNFVGDPSTSINGIRFIFKLN